MNDLDLLRGVRADVREPEPVVLAGARRLLDEVAGSTREPGRRVRRPARLVAAGGVVVLLVAGGVLLGDPVDPAPASAASLLGQAARTAEAADAPGPGEYLRITTRDRSLGYVVEGPRTGAFEWNESTVVYAPYDRTDVWVQRSWADPPGRVFGGPEVQAAAQSSYASYPQRSDVAESRTQGGAFALDVPGDPGPPHGPARVEDLPREPRALLTALGQQGDGSAVGVARTATQYLRTGLVPSDLTPVFLEALQLLPGIRVTDRAVALDGSTGTAIGVTDGIYAPSVILDPDTGEFLGTREVQLTDLGDVPAGTVSSLTSVSTEVVSAVPAGE